VRGLGGLPAHIRSIKYVARSRVNLAELSGYSDDGDPESDLYNHLVIPK
jgi:hypothetical protein